MQRARLAWTCSEIFQRVRTPPPCHEWRGGTADGMVASGPRYPVSSCLHLRDMDQQLRPPRLLGRLVHGAAELKGVLRHGIISAIEQCLAGLDSVLGVDALTRGAMVCQLAQHDIFADARQRREHAMASDSAGRSEQVDDPDAGLQDQTFRARSWAVNRPLRRRGQRG
jgi:hypothetical protein